MTLAWGVARVNDDGRAEIVSRDMCELAADIVAGALRDASTEQEIGAGWNYLPRKIRKEVEREKRSVSGRHG